MRGADNNLPIKTLEFRDSEKSALEPSAGVYSPNAVSAIISRENPGVHPLTGGSGTKSHLSTRLIHQHTPCSSPRHKPRRTSPSQSSTTARRSQFLAISPSPSEILRPESEKIISTGISEEILRLDDRETPGGISRKRRKINDS